jgi:UDP-N-acetyl-D-glucosamine dehydrogenase
MEAAAALPEQGMRAEFWTGVMNSSLLARFSSAQGSVGILGLGYVGLPMAVEAAAAGFKVVGLDLSQAKVDGINAGRSHIKDVSDAELQAQTGPGRLRATTDFDAIKDLDAVIIAVPTPLDEHLNPDLSFVESAGRLIEPRLKPGQLVVLKSTTYPGTTEDVLRPILEKGGLKAEEDFLLAYAPERVDPGNPTYNTKNTPKVVGGVGPKSLEAAVALFGSIVDQVVPVSSCASAELTKVFENTFRAVNIGLVNELTMLCDRMGIDVWEVIHAANTKPFGIMKFMPGPGVGGHCIPLDPHYLEWKAREYNFRVRFIELAGEVNRRMPDFVAEKAMRILNEDGLAMKGRRALLLGMAYKRDIDDWRESPAIHVLASLEALGAEVVFHDPYLPEFEEHGRAYRGVELTDEELEKADLVVVTTPHSNVDYARVLEKSRRILDAREAMSGLDDPDGKVTKL